MTWTGYFRNTSGTTLYAKPLPLQTTTWGGDVVSGSETGATGSFVFSNLTLGVVYEVFEQAGASPASSDVALGSIEQQVYTIDTNPSAGPYVATLTTKDGSTTIADAIVRVVMGAESYTGTTNSQGKVTFYLAAGTWTVYVYRPLYTMTPVQITVSADTSQDLALSPVTIPPSSPGLIGGYWYVYDQSGVPEAGVTVEIKLVALANAGTSPDLAVRTFTSDAAGLVSVTNLWPGGRYSARRGTGPWRSFTIPATATDPYALPSLVGSE